MAATSPKHFPKRVKRWNTSMLIQVWIFFLILLFFQLMWDRFETEITTFPFFVLISDSIGNVLLTLIPAIINPVFKVDIIREGISLILPNGLYISFFFYLSGVKQMCLIVVLFLLVQGPWQKKFWFIPACLTVLLFTVFFRFFLLNLHCLTQPEQLHMIKDFLFRPLFYFEILIMWMVWVFMVAKTARLRRTIPVDEQL